ncbi:MAG: acetyl-CoA carboxylase carboxyltransferase subunit alpha [bacterium]|nr:acetyl-CoA carboxylase carboxyltransferase subunit alpha [bacterium]
MENIYLDFERPIEELENKIIELTNEGKTGLDVSNQIKKLEEQANILRNKIFSHLTPWQVTQLARHPQRPGTTDYIANIFTNFIELHGDRRYADDPAIIAGIASLDEQTVFIIGHQKGKDTKTNLRYNFGMPHPEGYRKAGRVMKLAEKFKKPLLTFIDTPGAYPGIGAEERGQGDAIAQNLFTMSQLKTQIIVTIIGEGGSGGALAIGVGDKILMLENAVYSVISPEGCAAILWEDKKKVDSAAATLRLTAKNLLELEVIDEIIPEPVGGAHRNIDEICRTLKKGLSKSLSELQKHNSSTIVLKRYKKFRKMGQFIEKNIDNEEKI